MHVLSLTCWHLIRYATDQEPEGTDSTVYNTSVALAIMGCFQVCLGKAFSLKVLFATPAYGFGVSLQMVLARKTLLGLLLVEFIARAHNVFHVFTGDVGIMRSAQFAFLCTSDEHTRKPPRGTGSGTWAYLLLETWQIEALSFHAVRGCGYALL